MACQVVATIIANPGIFCIHTKHDHYLEMIPTSARVVLGIVGQDFGDSKSNPLHVDILPVSL
jgi:hypothetical protein